MNFTFVLRDRTTPVLAGLVAQMAKMDAAAMKASAAITVFGVNYEAAAQEHVRQITEGIE